MATVEESLRSDLYNSMQQLDSVQKEHREQVGALSSELAKAAAEHGLQV